MLRCALRVSRFGNGLPRGTSRTFCIDSPGLARPRAPADEPGAFELELLMYRALLRARRAVFDADIWDKYVLALVGGATAWSILVLLFGLG